MLQLTLCRKIQAYIIWGIILGCLSLPSLLASVPSDEQDGKAASSKTSMPNVPWESSIKEETKTAIKELLASFSTLIQKDNDNDIREFIYKQLIETKALKQHLIPDAYKHQDSHTGGRQIKIRKGKEQYIYPLEEIPATMLYIFAARALWDHQNILLDIDIVNESSLNLNQYASKNPPVCCEANHREFSLFADYIYYKCQRPWIKASLVAQRVEYFSNLFGFNRLLVKVANVEYDPLDYKVALFRLYLSDTLYGLKRMLADIFPIQSYEDDLFSALKKHEDLSHASHFIDVWRYTLARKAALDVCLTSKVYYQASIAALQLDNFKNAVQQLHVKESEKLLSGAEEPLGGAEKTLNRGARKKGKALEPSPPTRTGISAHVDIDAVTRYINGRLDIEILKKKEKKASSSSTNPQAKNKHKAKNKLKEEIQPSTANTTTSENIAPLQNEESAQAATKDADESSMTTAAPVAEENQPKQTVNRWLQRGSLIPKMIEVEKQEQQKKGTQQQQASQASAQNSANTKKPIALQSSALQADSQKVKPALTKEPYKQRASAAPSKQAPTVQQTQQPDKNFKRTNNLG